ncbi:hypothetical protein EUTSA_v10000652mg, partial [Eutrema salsugineum]
MKESFSIDELKVEKSSLQLKRLRRLRTWRICFQFGMMRNRIRILSRLSMQSMTPISSSQKTTGFWKVFWVPTSSRQKQERGAFPQMNQVTREPAQPLPLPPLSLVIKGRSCRYYESALRPMLQKIFNQDAEWS